MTIADIVLETRSLANADSAQFSDAAVLRRINAAYEEINGKLISLDNNWDFGDSNYAALPTGLQNLVAGQNAYTWDATLLVLQRLSVLDTQGIWHVLKPITLEDLNGADIAEYQKTNGLPCEYLKRENTAYLFPAPSASYVTLTNGLKAKFKRVADLFTSSQVSTGTKTPGFAAPFHVLLAYKAALPYCVERQLPQKNDIASEVARMEKDMMAFYTKRGQDERARMTMKGIIFA